MTAAAYEEVSSDQVRPRQTRKRAAAKPRPVGPQYVARKPMKIGEKKIKIGDPVPEAHSWPRVEAWVRAGYLDVVE